MKITAKLIAPCGLDCGLCRAFLREKNKCPGCNNFPSIASCKRCKIKNCNKRAGEFCISCKEFPCEKIKHLHNRYMKKYETDLIDNQMFIKENGIKNFVEKERQKYQSEKGTYCMHDKKYY